MSKNVYQSIPAFSKKAHPVIPIAESVRTSNFMMVREGGTAAECLNEEQLAAVSHLEGPAVVNAGAGTGKTKVLVERVKRIKQQYPEAKVLLVTFTKKSALEIKERIAGATGIQVSTFHSLSYHILIRDNDRKFTVLTSDSYRKSIIAKLIGSKSGLSTDDVIFAIKLCAKDAIVYFHEICHGAHNTFCDLRHCDHDIAETVAEFSAVVLAHIQGITGYERQGWEYIKRATHNKENPEAALKFIMQCLSDVEKVVTIILEAAENNNPNEKAPELEAV